MSTSNSTFRLANLKPNMHFQLINIDYEPMIVGDNVTLPIIPKFNQDKKYFTKAFLNPYEKFLQIKKKNCEEQAYSEMQKESFQKAVKQIEAEDQKKVIKFEPMGDSYCHICYCSFQDYFEHVNSRSHRSFIKSSQANTYIKDLCRKYNKKSQLEQRRQKKQEKSQSLLRKGKNGEKKKKKIPRNFEYPNEDSQYNKEDFIIKLPLDLFEKQKEKEVLGTPNNSTNINSNYIQP